MNELNPFQHTDNAPQPSAMMGAEEARASQEVQAAIISAKRFPRSEMKATDRILNACTRVKLAENSLYSYSRGGSEITGPSIRLAEVIAQHWGNMDFGVRELSQREGVSTVQTYAWDLETNVRETRTFEVPHFIMKRGNQRKVLTDPRDIYEHIANQGARRLRACILAIIPGDVVEAAVEQSTLTLTSSIDMTKEGLANMLASFAKIGVDKAALVEWAGVHFESIRPAQMVRLRSIYASIQDGMSEPGDWFKGKEPQEPQAEQQGSASERLKGRLSGPDTHTDTSKDEKPAESGSQEPQQGTSAPAKAAFEAELAKIAEASTIKELNKLANSPEHMAIYTQVGPAWKGALTRAISNRQVDITKEAGGAEG